MSLNIITGQRILILACHVLLSFAYGIENNEVRDAKCKLKYMISFIHIVFPLKCVRLFWRSTQFQRYFFSFSFYFSNHKVSGKYISTCYLFYLSIYLRVGMRYAINYFKFSHFRMIRVKEELVMAPVLQSKFASKATFYLFLLPLSM